MFFPYLCAMSSSISLKLYYQLVDQILHPCSTAHSRVSNSDCHGMGKTFKIRIKVVTVSMGSGAISTIKPPVDDFVIVLIVPGVTPKSSFIANVHGCSVIAANPVQNDTFTKRKIIIQMISDDITNILMRQLRTS